MSPYIYLKKTKDFGLYFSCESAPALVAFTDSDWSNERDRISVGAFVVKSGGTVSWQSKKQTIIATSTTEAEYSAYLDVCKEILWLRQLRKDIMNRIEQASKHNTTEDQILNEVSKEGDTKLEATTVYPDSTMGIKTIKGVGMTARTRHFDIRLKKSRELQQLEIVDFQYVHTNDNTADVLTKALPSSRHWKLFSQFSLVDVKKVM